MRIGRASPGTTPPPREQPGCARRRREDRFGAFVRHVLPWVMGIAYGVTESATRAADASLCVPRRSLSGGIGPLSAPAREACAWLRLAAHHDDSSGAPSPWARPSGTRCERANLQGVRSRAGLLPGFWAIARERCSLYGVPVSRPTNTT